MPETLYTTFEAARVLRCSESHVRQLVKRGSLPVAFLTGYGKRLFHPVEVDRLRAARSAA